MGVTALLLAGGCGGDISRVLATDAQMRDQVMSAIAGNGELAGAMMDRLLGGDTTRALVLDRLMANGPAMQNMMARIAGNRTMIDGILNVAVQDTGMKRHVMTLFKGMEMGAGSP
jgi:hypothetical protein